MYIYIYIYTCCNSILIALYLSPFSAFSPTRERAHRENGDHVGRNHVGRFTRTGCTGWDPPKVPSRDMWGVPIFSRWCKEVILLQTTATTTTKNHGLFLLYPVLEHHFHV